MSEKLELKEKLAAREIIDIKITKDKDVEGEQIKYTGKR